MMKRSIRKIFALLLAGALLTALLSACGGKPEIPQEPEVPEEEEIQLKELTMDVFSDYDLTLVNAFATWCSPCIQEIPELDALHKDIAEKHVNVIGIALDTITPNQESMEGTLDEEAVGKVIELIKRTGAAYPMYIPDMTMWSGSLYTIASLPTTFFVDREGNIVGGVYVGARDQASWAKIVDDELAKLEASK